MKQHQYYSIVNFGPEAKIATSISKSVSPRALDGFYPFHFFILNKQSVLDSTISASLDHEVQQIPSRYSSRSSKTLYTPVVLAFSDIASVNVCCSSATGLGVLDTAGFSVCDLFDNALF